jgi:hypothetical protein
MRIQIKSYMNIPEIPSHVEMEKGTLRDLLIGLFSQVHFSKEMIDPITRDLKDDTIFETLLNGVSHHTLPSGIDTELGDADIVTLSLIMLGGG